MLTPHTFWPRCGAFYLDSFFQITYLCRGCQASRHAARLDVQSRDEVASIGFEYSQIFLSSLGNGLIRRFSSQRLEMVGKVEGTHESEHMRLQAL